MRNNFCYPLKMVMFVQYCDSNTGLFCITTHLVIALPTLRYQKLSLLISLLQFCMSFVDGLRLLFCIASHINITLPTIATLLKALPKINGNLTLSPLRARKSDNYRYRDSLKSDKFRKEAIKKKQRTDTKKNAKRIKSDTFTRGIREKSNIAIAKLEKNNDWMAP